MAKGCFSELISNLYFFKCHGLMGICIYLLNHRHFELEKGAFALGQQIIDPLP